MAYVDTNIVIAYYFREDPNHRKAAKVVEVLRKEGKEMIISPLTLTELHSIFSRRSGTYALPPRIRAIAYEKLKIYIC